MDSCLISKLTCHLVKKRTCYLVLLSKSLSFLTRILTNFYNLQELHLTNAFTELIDSKWYLGDLKDIFLTSNMTNLYKLHLEQNEIW